MKLVPSRKKYVKLIGVKYNNVQYIKREFCFWEYKCIKKNYGAGCWTFFLLRGGGGKRLE